jgi:hypothetical protein
MSATQRFRVTVAVVAVCCLVPLGYSALHLTMHRASLPPPAPAPTGPASRPSVTDMALQVTPAAYQLPAPLSREVVLPGAGGLMIAGGLTARGTSTDSVTSLDPVTGATR